MQSKVHIDDINDWISTTGDFTYRPQNIDTSRRNVELLNFTLKEKKSKELLVKLITERDIYDEYMWLVKLDKLDKPPIVYLYTFVMYMIGDVDRDDIIKNVPLTNNQHQILKYILVNADFGKYMPFIISILKHANKHLDYYMIDMVYNILDVEYWSDMKAKSVEYSLPAMCKLSDQLYNLNEAIGDIVKNTAIEYEQYRTDYAQITHRIGDVYILYNKCILKKLDIAESRIDRLSQYRIVYPGGVINISI